MILWRLDADETGLHELVEGATHTRTTCRRLCRGPQPGQHIPGLAPVRLVDDVVSAVGEGVAGSGFEVSEVDRGQVQGQGVGLPVDQPGQWRARRELPGTL